MKRILIADASKASLVITSEVFKDHFPGVQVVVARNAADAVELAKSDPTLDAIVLDFDLPDRDGAETAARLKKLVQTPILITGFPREGVSETIARACAGYDDCLNWLRKPVKPELVVAIAQRYCEGKFRTQRRVNCAVPALFELAVTVQTPVLPALAKGKAAAAAKGKAKGKGVADKGKVGAKKVNVPAPKMVTTVKKTWIPAYVEDCSLGGLRLRIPRDKVENLTLGEPALNAVSALKSGEVLNIQLPKWQTIAENEELSHNLLTRASFLQKQAAATQRSPGKAKAAPAAKTKAPAQTEMQPTAALPSLKGKVAWTTLAETKTEWIIGIQSENAAMSKKLFETIVETAES